MVEKNITMVKAYYTAMNEKNLTAMAPYLHQNITLITPLAKEIGKETILNSAQKFLSALESLSIRAICGTGNQVIAIIDMHCCAPIGMLRTAVFITFQDDLIISNELFYDTKTIGY